MKKLIAILSIGIITSCSKEEIVNPCAEYPQVRFVNTTTDTAICGVNSHKYKVPPLDSIQFQYQALDVRIYTKVMSKYLLNTCQVNVFYY